MSYTSATISTLIAEYGSNSAWARLHNLPPTEVSRLCNGRLELSYARLLALCEELPHDQAKQLCISWLRDHVPTQCAQSVAVLPSDQSSSRVTEDGPFYMGSDWDLARLPKPTADALRYFAQIAHDPDIAEWLKLTKETLEYIPTKKQK